MKKSKALIWYLILTLMISPNLEIVDLLEKGRCTELEKYNHGFAQGNLQKSMDLIINSISKKCQTLLEVVSWPMIWD